MSPEELPLKRSCGSTALYYRMLEQDPEFGEQQLRLEAFTAQTRMLGDALRQLETEPSKIPVVVHVVYNTATENISNAQIHSQIEVLNTDFRARNTDQNQVPPVWEHLIADARVEFVLADKDPDGNPTDGITRRKTDKTGFDGFNNEVKYYSRGGTDAWVTDRYLNLWVCTLKGNILGYAQFPGGKPETDGVVILNRAFGTTGTATHPFDKGRTATHEVGHWFNLRHIWGDTNDCSGTDFVDDTPPAQRPNYNDPTYPSVSCNNGPDGDMFMNYMDYVNDASMCMFTLGQVERMTATLIGPRSGFSN